MHILLKALHSCKGMGWSLCLPFDPFDISWWEGGGGLGRGRRLHVKDRGEKKTAEVRQQERSEGDKVGGGLDHFSVDGKQNIASCAVQNQCTEPL